VCARVRDLGVIPVKDDVCVLRIVFFLLFPGYVHVFRETPVHRGLFIHKDETVQAAHCDCMARHGEACTHEAALLFVIEANV